MGSIVLPATARQTASIIFLHGLGDSGASWAEILPSLIPSYAKLILPHAPVRPVTLNQGIRMPAWFDLRPVDQPKDAVGIKMAADQIQELIHKETKEGIPANRVAVGGFSQGGALALFSGLTLSTKLAGILALSTWMPLRNEIIWDEIQKPTVLQCHGDEDQMISLDSAEKTAKHLHKFLPSYTFKIYPGLDHSVSSKEETKDISDFFKTVLPQADASKL